MTEYHAGDNINYRLRKAKDTIEEIENLIHDEDTVLRLFPQTKTFVREIEKLIQYLSSAPRGNV